MAKKKNNKNLTTGIVIVVLVIVVTVSAAYYQQLSPNNTSIVSESNLSESTESIYRNGVYKVRGNYISPGGAEEIDVTITLEDGVITGSEVIPQATHEISVRMQNDFKNNYKQFVIGRNIDEVNLTKVSGSSLTPGGFNDALEKIKDQASS